MKFSAEISDELDDQIKKFVPYGNQSEVVRKLFETLFEACGENPAMVYLLLADKVKLVVDPGCSTIEQKGD